MNWWTLVVLAVLAVWCFTLGQLLLKIERRVARLEEKK